MDIVLGAAQPPVLTTPYPDDMCKITFRHPSYDDANNIMLLLYAPDAVKDPVTDVTSWGLYAQYALDACGIIACNRFDGWLSEFKEVDQAATPAGRIDAGSILQGKTYYFHVPKLDGDDAADTPYPIVRTFQQWSFPHGNLPDSWTRAVLPDPHYATPLKETYARLNIALHARDGTCRITGCISGVQAAHLCPLKEKSWWSKNNMAVYGVIDHSSNALLLRSDLLQCFDERRFVFAPKPSSGPEGTTRTHFVIHSVQFSKELHTLYHNRKLQAISMKRSLPWLFVRFAWALFNEHEHFLESPHFGSNQAEDTPTETTHCTSSAKRRKLDPNAASGGETSTTAAPTEATSEGPSPPPVPDARLTSPPSRGRQPTGADEAEPALESRVREWLARERERSDPEHRWEREKAWAQMVMDEEVVLGEAAARRLGGILSGGDVFDADAVGSPFREEKAREPDGAGAGP